MTEEGTTRMIGACDGYVHALVILKITIGRMRYHPLDPRHTRKIAERDRQILPLQQIYDRLAADLRRLQTEIAQRSAS